MTITVGETVTEVIVKAYTTLQVENVTIEVKGRAARIAEVEIYWFWQEGSWRIDFIQLTGPFVNEDGRDSLQTLNQSSRPQDDDEGGYGRATPPEIVRAAWAHVPEWTPELAPSPYRAR